MSTSPNHLAASTTELFRADAYLRTCQAHITHIERNAHGMPTGVVLSQTVFYPLGGGQAGDAGWLTLPDGSSDGGHSGLKLAVADTRKAKDADGQPTGGIVHVFASDTGTLSTDSLGSLLQHLMQSQTPIEAQIDWERRHRLMRFHTSTHLLCHLVPALVNGCSITPDAARMDLVLTEPLDKDALTDGLARLVSEAHPVAISSVTDAELDANPALVKSMSVQPPRGSGEVRTVRVGNPTEPDSLIDLQPCGGTHVANTAEIGRVVVTKIEKKSATTRRVVLGFAA